MLLKDSTGLCFSKGERGVALGQSCRANSTNIHICLAIRITLLCKYNRLGSSISEPSRSRRVAWYLYY